MTDKPTRAELRELGDRIINTPAEHWGIHLPKLATAEEQAAFAAGADAALRFARRELGAFASNSSRANALDDIDKAAADRFRTDARQAAKVRRERDNLRDTLNQIASLADGLREGLTRQDGSEPGKRARPGKFLSDQEYVEANQQHLREVIDGLTQRAQKAEARAQEAEQWLAGAQAGLAKVTTEAAAALTLGNRLARNLESLHAKLAAYEGRAP